MSIELTPIPSTWELPRNLASVHHRSPTGNVSRLFWVAV